MDNAHFVPADNQGAEAVEMRRAHRNIHNKDRRGAKALHRVKAGPSYWNPKYSPCPESPLHDRNWFGNQPLEIRWGKDSELNTPVHSRSHPIPLLAHE